MIGLQWARVWLCIGHLHPIMSQQHIARAATASSRGPSRLRSAPVSLSFVVIKTVVRRARRIPSARGELQQGATNSGRWRLRANSVSGPRPAARRYIRALCSFLWYTLVVRWHRNTWSSVWWGMVRSAVKNKTKNQKESKKNSNTLHNKHDWPLSDTQSSSTKLKIWWQAADYCWWSSATSATT